MKDLLTKLLQAAATKGNVGPVILKRSQDYIEANIQKIERGKNICDSISLYTIQLIVEELRSKECSKDLLKEIEEYSAPKLKKNDDFQPLKDILQLNNSSVIVIQGEAGMGKTAMSRFLFNSWLSGNMESVEGLSSFDVVIKVDCNQIYDRDINLFYERLFPKASFTFPNTNSFKKSLDEFNVFWIMDGFDESTAEFKGFLTAMTNSLSKKHKLLITTRPHPYEDLKKYLSELSMTSLTLESLQDHNVDEIIESLITEDEKKETFKINFHNLDETAKDLLRTPLNLHLFIKLWMQNPELVRDTYTTKLLLLKTISNYLSLLQERLVGRTFWSSEDLKGYVEDWFYGSLCKQSFFMLKEDRLNFITKEDLDTLRKGARNSMLDPSMCLSTFLVQGKKNDWKDEGECKNDDDSKEYEYDIEESEEEDIGEIRYKFHHSTQQQFILASLFLKHFKDYDGENVIYNIPRNIFQYVRLIAFYVEMIIEDGSLDKDCTQLFYPIQSIINRSASSVRNKSDIWFSSSVASKFNVKYMEKVSQAFKDIPYLFIYCSCYDINGSLGLTNLKKFLDFVRPQKIILLSLSFKFIQEEYFQPLLEFLINSKLEIEIQFLDYYDSSTFVSDDAFCGTLDSFLDNSSSNWTEKIKTICIKVNNENRLNKIYFEKLKEYEALERLEIRINLDSFLLPIPTNNHNLPKEMVEITTLGLTGLYIENFEKVLEELNKKKGEGSLKFKALHHDFEDISETDKRQLQQIAHTVSIDFICQCKKDVIEKIVKLNTTSFDGHIQVLNVLSAHYANLKSVFLYIQYKRELYRTLKFLRDYKANLDDVKIELWSSELVGPENRTSAIPQELVQRTSICIRCINVYNFQDFLTLLNNLRGNKTLKFKAIYTNQDDLSLHHLEMLNQFTGNLSCIEDFDNDSQRYFIR